MMTRILGIETSCDDTGAAIYDAAQSRVLSNVLYSQVAQHKKYGGVVPEIASRSQLEKIEEIVSGALTNAQITLNDVDAIAVTCKPGLIGSLLVGICFAKALAFSTGKPLIGVDHLEGHLFSSFLKDDGSVEQSIPFPHLSITASGGHTAMYLVHNFGKYTLLAETLDDAAGEAFDKIAKIIGFGYPGGPAIEREAKSVDFEDFFKYPRTKNKNGDFMFSFSGLKTAILYSLVKMGAYDLSIGPIKSKITPELQKQVSSSLLVCITDIFEKNIKLAFEKHPEIKALTFGGGVACNRYIVQRLTQFCKKRGAQFFSPARQFCMDNGGMIAFVGSYKAAKGQFSTLELDASR